ncbi:hypothetical protein [Tenacibaculum jejuense]|uniref:Probable lipoprotein n=1 Tax=Tenacibaculum jejuense TaxID=584609 RepID=A0A238U7Q9_9FLAO|nr:hypothetical protein [Tenacibaculum jejuense]SNR15223.1 Probable lipoprotein precursor [Tenacibaculum jejuense]
MKKVFLLIMITIMAIGCKEEEVVTNLEQEEIAFQQRDEYDILEFKSFDELGAYIKEKNSANLLEEAKESAKEKGFLSLLLLYNISGEEAKELGIERTELPAVKSNSSLFLSILNKDGEVIIDDKIYRIDEDFVYTYRAGSGDEINDFKEKYRAGKIEIKSEVDYQYSKGLSVFKYKSKKIEARTTQFGSVNINNNVRLRGAVFNENLGFINFVGGSTWVERRISFWFFSFWVPTISDNSLNYDLLVDVNPYSGAPSQTVATGGSWNGTNYFTTQITLFNFGTASYSINSGGSLHETYWGTSPTGSFHDIFFTF